MDPVSEILADRERARPGLWPWLAVAVLLHGLVVAGIFLFGRIASARPAQLPVVSVRLVRPQQPPARRPARRRPQPTVAAPPTPVPTEVPQPQPTTVPTEAVSDDAMPAREARSTPQPESTPAEGPPKTGRGLSLGEGASRQVPGIPADFHFGYYIERMLALIESRWYKPSATAGTRARIRFRILRDGRLEDIMLEESSGVPSFDRAALRAMYAANPLPPLPPAYGKQSLTVHLTFSE